MASIRMSYNVNGREKHIVWSPRPYEQSMADFAIELMRIERPLVVYQVGDMARILKQNGIGRLRSPDIWIGNFRKPP